MRIGVRTTKLNRHPNNAASWLEPEELAYTAKGSQVRKCHVMFPDGKMRIAFCGIPDTYFSIPAHCRIKGKYIAGYISTAENCFEFRVVNTHKIAFTNATGYIWPSENKMMRTCIRDGCGLPFDSNEPETRDTSTLKAFWYKYCPKHRIPSTPNVIVTNQPPKKGN